MRVTLCLGGLWAGQAAARLVVGMDWWGSVWGVRHRGWTYLPLAQTRLDRSIDRPTDQSVHPHARTPDNLITHPEFHALPQPTGLRVPVTADVLVSVGDGENIDNAVKRFKREVSTGARRR